MGKFRMAAKVVSATIGVDHPPPRGRPAPEENWLERTRRLILVDVDKEAEQRALEAREKAREKMEKEMKEAEEAEELARKEAEEARVATEALETAKVCLQAALRIGIQGPIDEAQRKVGELQAVADREQREAEEAAENAERERREAEEARANADEKKVRLEEGKAAEIRKDWGVAEVSYSRALALAEEDYGLNHSFTCECARGVARAFTAQRRYREAVGCLVKALRACEWLLSESIGGAAFNTELCGPLAEVSPEISRRYRDLIDTLEGLADAYETYKEEGKTLADMAEPLRRRVVDLKEVLYGVQCSEIPMALHRLATCLHLMKRPADALEQFQCALSIAEYVVGQHGPQVVDVSYHLASLGHFYRKEKRIAEAEPCFKRALSAAERGFGRRHVNTASRISDYGSILRQAHKYAEALPLFEECVDIKISQLGPNHFDVGKCREDVAWAMQGLGRLQEAEEQFDFAVKIALRCAGHKGEAAPETIMGLAVVKQQIALRMDIVHRKQDKLEEAQPLFEEALKIREGHLGKDSPLLEKELDNLAIMYQAQGLLNKSRPFAERAWRIRFNHRADLSLKRLKTEMKQGTAASQGMVATLAAELQSTIKNKKRSEKTVSRCVKALEKTHESIRQCKENFAQNGLRLEEAMMKVKKYVAEAHPGTREQNKRMTKQRAVEAEITQAEETYKDDGIALGQERRKREATLASARDNHSRICASEASLRAQLKKAQEDFVQKNVGFISQAFRIFDEDDSGGLSHAEARRVMQGLGQLPSDDTADAVFEELVRQVDEDGDGNVDYNEFVNLIVARIPSVVEEEEDEEVLNDDEAAFQDQQSQLGKGGLAAASSSHQHT